VDSLGDLADRVLILKEGALAYAGTVADLRRQAPCKRFVVHLNGTAPSEFVDALGAIGVKSDSIVPAAESWDDLLAKVTSGDETTDAGSG
jgi:ABC-type uncharacterized transport system ATPase subunit